jgi:hypothetical protein
MLARGGDMCSSCYTLGVILWSHSSVANILAKVVPKIGGIAGGGVPQLLLQCTHLLPALCDSNSQNTQPEPTRDMHDTM